MKAPTHLTTLPLSLIVIFLAVQIMIQQHEITTLERQMTELATINNTVAHISALNSVAANRNSHDIGQLAAAIGDLSQAQIGTIRTVLALDQRQQTTRSLR